MKNNKAYQYHELLPLIKQGDQRAFALLYDLFSKDLIAFIAKKITNSEVASD